jgi:signal transduction histidine kinase
VWARDPALVGRVVADDAWLRRALAGQVAARLDAAGDLDVYAPLDAGTRGWAVLRVSSKAGMLVSERRRLRAMAWSLGLAGGLLLWLGAVIVLERILRGQARQREMLASKLSATERLRAAGEIAAGVAHDLNNLFSVLAGHLFLLRERGGADTRSLDAMEAAVRDGTAAMRRLRQMVRREEEPFVPVDAGQLVREATAMVEPLIKARAGIELRVELDGQAPVLGRPAELREVLVNLMLNAVDAMPQGGRLTATSSRRGRRVCLEVADTGVGMSAELRERIFDPFFTTKQNGTGLGLAVARGIVVRHGGEIRVESEPGRGSRFVVDLPATGGGPAAP